MIRGLHPIRGPVLNPLPEGGVAYWPDGLLVGDERGRIVAAGAWDELAPRFALEAAGVPRSVGLILPPLLDAHRQVRGRQPADLWL